MRFFLLCMFLFSTVATTYAQGDLTTFILIRHAEKADDGTRNPGLTAEGEERAERFKDLFAEAGITAIYSTPYKRTESTVAPLSKHLGMEVNLYDPGNRKFLDEITKEQKGGTIVISGHSNTTPFAANMLIGEQRFKQLDEKEYGKIFMITISESGVTKTSVLNY